MHLFQLSHCLKYAFISTLALSKVCIKSGQTIAWMHTLDSAIENRLNNPENPGEIGVPAFRRSITHIEIAFWWQLNVAFTLHSPHSLSQSAPVQYKHTRRSIAFIDIAFWGLFEDSWTLQVKSNKVVSLASILVALFFEFGKISYWT